MMDVMLTPDLAAAAFERSRARMRSFAYTIVRDEQLAEDVVQEVGLSLASRLPEVDDLSHFERWLLRVTRHRAIDCYRQRRGQPVALSEGALAAIEDSFAEEGEGETTAALARCVAKLSRYGQQLVRLRYREGLIGAALARRLKRKPNAVYVALSRVHKELGACVRRQLGMAS